eukprot:IDg14553t1
MPLKRWKTYQFRLKEASAQQTRGWRSSRKSLITVFDAVQGVIGELRSIIAADVEIKMTRTPRHQKALQVKSRQSNPLPGTPPQTNQTADFSVYQ